jgi:mannose-6-phosphate isomerase
MTLRNLMEARSEELLGWRAPQFPLLIKILDARENLSVQVHPDDDLARTWAPAEGGKTEAWLILHADPHAVIYLGLKPGMDKRTLQQEIARGTLTLCLHRYDPLPGQCYFVPAGAVHALGGGLVVLEVQQTSDATFRLYDWGRVDAANQPREIHLEAGLACIKEQLPEASCRQPSADPTPRERLASCAHFHLDHLEVNRPLTLQGPLALVGLEGRAQMHSDVGPIPLARGETILLPAALPPIEIIPAGRCRLACIEVPRSRDPGRM